MIGASRPATVRGATCPLCGGAAERPSWLGATEFSGRTFTYRACDRCGSLRCDPMPDDAVLSTMYGPSYLTDHLSDAGADTTRDSAPVLAWLARVPRGVFVDYGCGRGHLLAEARARGWTAIGVEFGADLAAVTAKKVGVRVLDRAEAETLTEPIADVLHLGDVLEHLTRLPDELSEILRLVRPGGLVLAQGPLEANANVFTWAIRASRAFRGARVARMAPYHVILATTRGQRALFERAALATIEFRVHEVSWPAPARLARRDLRPRPVALFALRRVSRGVTRMAPARLGNRYFYAGRWAGRVS